MRQRCKHINSREHIRRNDGICFQSLLWCTSSGSGYTTASTSCACPATTFSTVFFSCCRYSYQRRMVRQGEIPTVISAPSTFSMGKDPASLGGRKLPTYAMGARDTDKSGTWHNSLAKVSMAGMRSVIFLMMGKVRRRPLEIRSSKYYAQLYIRAHRPNEGLSC